MENRLLKEYASSAVTEWGVEAEKIVLTRILVGNDTVLVNWNSSLKGQHGVFKNIQVFIGTGPEVKKELQVVAVRRDEKSAWFYQIFDQIRWVGNAFGRIDLAIAAEFLGHSEVKGAGDLVDHDVIRLIRKTLADR